MKLRITPNGTVRGLWDDTIDWQDLGRIGLLALPDQEHAPLIHIHYRDWSRQKLEIVRESLRAGLVLAFSHQTDGSSDLHVSTRERIGLQIKQDSHTSALRAPAWDAHLEGIDERVTHRFEADRHRCGGFLLLVQTLQREFLSAVDDLSGQTYAGRVVPRSVPVRPGATG